MTSLGETVGRRPGAFALTVRPALERVRARLGIGRALSWLLVVVGAVVLTGVIAAATVTNLLVPALGGAVAVLVALVSLRWSVVPLFAFAFLIPIEEVVVLGPLGTLSRYAEILFIVSYAVPRLGRLPIRAMPLAAWGYVVWATASVVWASDRAATLTELPILGLLFATAVVVAAYVVEHPSVVRPLFWMYSLSAGATAVLGLASYFSSGVLAGPNDRAVALQDQNPAYYAAILLPAFVFCLSELLHGRRVLLSGAITMLCAAAIAASGTRATWASAIFVVLFFVLPRLAPVRRIAAIGLIVSLALGALQVPGLANVIIERADLALSTGGAGRTDIWTVGLTIYRSSPVTGVGLANFTIAYTPERVRRSDVGIYSANNPAYRAPHNIAIGTLGELGPIGVLLLGSFLLPLVLRRGWGPDADLVQAAFASLFVTSFFLDLLNRKQLWLIAGLACGLLYLRQAGGIRPIAREAASMLGLPASYRPRFGDGPPASADRLLEPGA